MKSDKLEDGASNTMTPEQRLERLENGWLQIQQALKAVIDSQARTIDSQARANEAIAFRMQAVIDSQARANEAIASMAESVGRYVDAADARMRRIEENLDALIRAITAEHSNGKGQQ